MKRKLTNRDVIMTPGVLDGLDYDSVSEYMYDGKRSSDPLDVKVMLARLREHPEYALELLSYEGSIIYMGASALKPAPGGKILGVRLADGGTSIEGDNVYGLFLDEVRREYLRELRSLDVQEEGERPGQITVDYYPQQDGGGLSASRIEEEEALGRRYIHTEPYRPAGFAFDAARDGTTGHARRPSDRGVAFQTFECPFGLDGKAKVRVETAAEMSLLYEKGLRGELDMKTTLADLRRRGLVKNLGRDAEADLVRDIESQFAWMREQICRDRSLRDATIVADGMLVPDSSFGRSIYDAQFAPSPAHVLARYINNPLLLYSSSANGVLRALESVDKDEQCRFSVINGKGVVRIVIDGSDTIGGRVPGTRAVSEQRPVYARDASGKVLFGPNRKPVVKSLQQTYKFQMKPQDAVDADYAAFAARLETVLANIDADTKVEFITGRGIGTPQMVRRFVQEHAGRVFDWDYATRRMVEERNDGAGESRYSQLRLRALDRVLPVIVGRQESATFLLDEGDEDSEVTFRRGDVAASGLVEFTVAADRNNAALLRRGSLAMGTGFSVIHVQENRTEEEQALDLSFAGSMSRNAYLGERTYDASLFDGRVRDAWDMDHSTVMSYVGMDDRLAVPFIAFANDAAVYVNGVGYHSVYAAYAALVMKASGVVDAAEYRRLAAGEDSVVTVSDILSRYDVDDNVQERCMRNAVHLMVQASSVFADSLIGAGGDIVVLSTFGGTRLFTDMEGHGENRFGVVLAAERDDLLHEMALENLKAEEDARHAAQENVRLQRKADLRRAEGQKMAGGLPAGIDAAAGAVWFLGTDRPPQLCLPEDRYSFIHWEEREYGRDTLNRELASRATVDAGDGVMEPNDLIFLFPSDLLAVQGRRKVRNNPDSKDLTGLQRVNPATGAQFSCAFGIPVKRDNLYFEFDNKLGRSCSFLRDQDSAAFRNAIVVADALARGEAMRQGMALCYAKRERNLPGGEENDDLGRVFMPRVWDFPRTREVIDRRTGRTVSEGGMKVPAEVRRRTYNSEKGRYEERTEKVFQKQWVDNPHAAPALRAMLRRYEDMLIEGAAFPLNCICLPRTDYSEVAEEKFIADFSFALSVANATAVANGVPMRFPLDAEGRLWLGPDVPERLRDLAEKKLDSFIGVVRDEGIINDRLPYISRIPIHKSVKKDAPFRGDASDIYMRPNDLVAAFGPYDFRALQRGDTVPLHEMAFTADDGTLFRVTDPRYPRVDVVDGDNNRNRVTKIPADIVRRYVNYSLNDECRFTVRSSDPDRIPAFITALKSYIERAKRIKVETRLLTEAEAQGMDLPLDGFVRLLASNSSSMAVEESDISARGDVTALDLPNTFDGTDNEGEYYGKEVARDSFAGYAQYRYTLPDGSRSGWITVTDKSLAEDIVRSGIIREYRSDVKDAPAPKILEAMLRTAAVKDADERFRSLSQEAAEVKEDDKVVGEAPVKAAGRLFVSYFGGRDIPDNAVKVQIEEACPVDMADDMDVLFKTVYPDSETMYEPYVAGRIDDAAFRERYNGGILEPNAERIVDSLRRLQEDAAAEGKDVYLLSAGKPGSFDHRYLLAEFLQEHGVECIENPADRAMYRTGRVEGEPHEVAQRPSVDEGVGAGVAFTVSEGKYSQRTWENANADDVDFTLQFAVDFGTLGEKATTKAAGDSAVRVDIPVKDGKVQMTRTAVNTMAQQVVNALPEEFLKGEPFGVNIAGNGIYTLAPYGVDQERLDALLSAVALTLAERGVNIRTVRSGGQTGVDESAVAIAGVLGVPVTVHGPADHAFRGADGRDVKGDEAAFRARFERKDIAAVKEAAKKLKPAARVRKADEGRKI